MSSEFYSLTINKVERLTEDSISLDFKVPDHLKEVFTFHQGQHLTLKADINGQDIRRSYSICKGVASQALKIGIKAIKNGVFSNFANSKITSGMALEVMPPQGHFYSEISKDSNKRYLLIAVGSGITPMLSQMETILESELNAQITLLYGNKKTSLMMFRESLCFLKNKYMGRLNMFNFFTQEENDSLILNGRISAQKIIDLDQLKMIQIQDIDEVFVCGPETMTLEIANAFKSWGFDDSRIHYELFFSGATAKIAEKRQLERAEKYGVKTSKVYIKLAGRKVQMELEMGGNSILDAAIKNGADLPFSCKAGVCATCKAKLTSGKVEMDTNHSLSEQELSDGMVLACQAHPISKRVELDFDFS